MTQAPETSRASGWRTIRRVAPYLWPEDAPELRRRVVLALAALLLAKAATVVTPFFFKAAVDALAPVIRAKQMGYLVAAGPVALTLFYGLMRLAGVGFAQARDGIFARVGQRALRLLALETFRHIHALSLRYHITRRTGGLSRIIERGVKGVDFLLRFLLFSIVPLVLELVLVGGDPVLRLRHLVFVVVALTIWVYVWFTFKVTEWRVEIRRRMKLTALAMRPASKSDARARAATRGAPAVALDQGGGALEQRARGRRVVALGGLQAGGGEAR